MKTAVNNLGTDTAIAGTKAANAAPGMIAAAIAMEAMNNAAKGINMESQVGKDITAVMDAYSGLMNQVANMGLDFTKPSITGDKGSSGKDPWVEEFEEQMALLKYL